MLQNTGELLPRRLIISICAVELLDFARLLEISLPPGVQVEKEI